MSARPHFIARLSFLLLLLAFSLMPFTSAFAQNTSLSQAVSLSKSAMEDYDFLELESADTKLIQAVQIIENLGVTDPSVANIYIAQGIVSYGRFKDSAPAIADERAFSAFLKALTLNEEITIPSDYRSEEVESIFERAKATIEAAPPSSAIALSAVKPSIEHTPVTTTHRCSALELRANVPAHPDIYRVYLYYAVDQQRGYTTVEMHPTLEASDVLTATIPALEIQGSKIQYYMEAQNRLGEVVANVANAPLPLTIEMTGECDGLSKSDIAQSYGDPLFQLSILAGTGLGVVSGNVENCLAPAGGGECNASTQGSQLVSVKTGMASLPFHLRGSAIFNLPKHFQVGLYVRGQIINIVSKTLSKNAKDNIDTPEIYNIMLGAVVRYLALHEQPYRLYVGLEIGWGGANASVPLHEKFNNFVDIYLYKGPVHVAPEIGFLWSFHKNVGMAFELAVPIHFPDKPSAHFDLSVGPFFQF